MKFTRIIFPISPLPHVRITQSDQLWMKIPEDCPYNCGLPRRKEPKDEGCRHCLAHTSLVKKRRIIRYYEYKEEIMAIAKQKRFNFPLSGAGLYFFFPIPKRRPRIERNNLHQGGHTQKPDIDNLAKAFLDGLFPGRDQCVCHLSGLGKYWVDTMQGTNVRTATLGSGWSEVHLGLPVYNPFTMSFEDGQQITFELKRNKIGELV